MNIDKMLGSIIGNKKTPNKSKIGASLGMQKMWKNMSPAKKQVMRSKLPDRDGDRVPDRFDCQPRNPMRQDGRNKLKYLTDYEGKKIFINQFLIDENGNIGKIIEMTPTGAIVDFGEEIGKESIHDEIGYFKLYK